MAMRSLSDIRSRAGVLTAFAVLVWIFPAGVDSAIGAPSAGTVLSAQKTTEGLNGMVGALGDFDFFGADVAFIGDIDGVGPSVGAIAVGARGNDEAPGNDQGAVWILFLDAGGAVIDEQQINAVNGGLTGPLDTDDFFGSGIAGLGDPDSDGLLSIAVGASGDDDNYGSGGNHGAVYILELNTDGTVATERKISAADPTLTGPLTSTGGFGEGLAFLGDQDGDGIGDIAVGASKDDDGGVGAGADRGAVWIISLAADGSVLADQKISDVTGGLTASLADGDGFGSSVTALGDLNGDGFGDIAVGAVGDNDGGGTGNQGAVHVLFLNSAGTVVGEQKISASAGGFAGTLDVNDFFGAGVAAVGDLDGDLINDLAVGARGDDDGAAETGAVWVLFLDTDGTVLAHQKISLLDGNMPAGEPKSASGFGAGVGAFGDFDGDGIFDLLVGADFDNTAGAGTGALHRLNLDGVPIVCGDSLIGFGEDCDDGNISSGDCCDDGCVFETVGSSCSDGDVCNGGELCDGAGTCDGGTPLDCDDSEICTADTCDPVGGCTNGPAAGCLVAAKASFQISDKADDSKDKLKWKWVKGDAFAQFDLGDPTATTSYRLCIFDQVAGVAQFAGKLEIAAPNGAWLDKAPRGWLYKDKSRAIDGVDKIKLKPGDSGKTQAQLSAKGAILGAVLPGPVGAQYFFQDTDVVVQLVNDPEGQCWETTLAVATKNLDDRYKAKAP